MTFQTRVEGVTRHSSSTDPNEGGHARWVINGKEDEPFDGIIVAVGTCGKPKMMVSIEHPLSDDMWVAGRAD